MLEEYDELSRRCPQLGGPVPFKYCRSVNMQLPCVKIAQCWAAKLDIVAWLEANFTYEQLEQVFGGEHRTRFEKILQIAHDVQKGGEE